MTPRILYLHGFRSSPASWKVRLLSDYMAAAGLEDKFVCPALSHVPKLAIEQAEALIAATAGPVALVGSSLGGYYATWLAEKHNLPAVLINPAVLAPLSLTSSYSGLIIAHTVIAVPFVVVPVLTALEMLDPNLARAAAACGATPGVAFMRVTLPGIMPAMASGGQASSSDSAGCAGRADSMIPPPMQTRLS